MEKHSGKRPFVTCHVFASIDGRIEGSYMFDPASSGSLGVYVALQKGFGADAVAYGSVTTKGFVGAGHPHVDVGTNVPEGDYVAAGAADAASYYVSLDSAGEIAWPSGTFRRAGRPDVHVIELLTEETPAAYRAYLCERGASYVVAGAHELDVALACEKLAELFGIKHLLVCGGGIADQSFLAAGALGELSVVFVPVATGDRNVATIFDAAPFAPAAPHAFALASAERVGGDGLHVVWRKA